MRHALHHVRLILFGIGFVFEGTGLLSAQPTDRLDTRLLGERGVIFEGVIPGRGNVRPGSGIGDVDGDHFDDVAIVFNERAPEENRTVVKVIFGRTGLTGRYLLDGSYGRTATIRVATSVPSQRVNRVAGVGDLNRDGFADFVVGVPTFDNAEASPGAVFLVHGSPEMEGEWALDDPDAGKGRTVRFSTSEEMWRGPAETFAEIGDYNGDGSSDLAFCLPWSEPYDRVGAGAVILLFQTRDLPAEVDLLQVGEVLPGIKIVGASRPYLEPEPFGIEQEGDWVGAEVAGAGDVNGDGYDDVLICSPTSFWHNLQTPERVILLYGGANPTPVIDLAEIEALKAAGSLSVFAESTRPTWFARRNTAARAGDVNADGYDDFLIGAPEYCIDPITGTPGNAYLFYGRPDLPRQIEMAAVPRGATFTIHGVVPDCFGHGVSPAGDLNGDGIPDFLVSAERAERDGMLWVGEVYAFYGRETFPEDLFVDEPFEGMLVLGESDHGGLGSSEGVDGLRPAGDFNGDGVDDLLLVAPGFGSVAHPEPDDVGRAYIIYGRGSGPPPLLLHEIEPRWGPIRGGTSVTIQGSGFRAGETQVSFEGRVAAGVEVISGSTLRATVPRAPRPGKVDVGVRVDAETKTLAGAFEYTPNYPDYDLQRLGSAGLILHGSRGSWPGPFLELGDLTGDGYDDLAAGSAGPSGGPSWVVTLVPGGAGLPAEADLLAAAGQISIVSETSDRQPSAAVVSILGDVDGDGLGDLGIGTGTGVGYILFGREIFDPEIDILAEVQAAQAVRLVAALPRATTFRLVLAPAGDFDGDGRADVAVALPERGIAWLKGEAGLPAAVELTLPEAAAGWLRGDGLPGFASELVAAGDVNGDGWPDLLANSTPGAEGGRAFLLFGAADLPQSEDVESFVASGRGVELVVTEGFAHLGWLNVAAAGDANGDGFDDILLGVEEGTARTGVTYLVPGGAGLPSRWALAESPAAPDGVMRVFGEGAMEQAGVPGPAGDFNGDGFEDFVVGGPGFQALAGEPGNVFVVFGGAELRPRLDLRDLGAAGIKVEGRVVFGGAGRAVSKRAGDLNGDGEPDLAFNEIGTPAEPGAVYVVYGAFGEKVFGRGDANRDERLDITDAVFLLTHLFLGGPPPPCPDAADADDLGSLGLTDAVYVLNHLFLGGPPPPAPYPDAGADPTEDALNCRGF